MLQKSPWRSLGQSIRTHYSAFLLIFPIILALTVVLYYPMLTGFHMTFFRHGEFVGLSNYQWLFNYELFGYSFYITVVFIVSTITLQLLVGLGIALVLNRIRFRAFWTALALSPYMVPPIAGGIIWVWTLDPSFGFLNNIFHNLGLGRVYFLVQGEWPLFSIILAQTWKDFGYASIIYLAALQQIPEELYESAMVEGAGGLQQFRYITMPFLRTATLIILAIRTNWNVVEFGLPFEMLSGGPGTKTHLLSILLYKLGFVRLELERAFVVGVSMIVLSLVAFFIYTRFLGGAMREEK